MTDTYKIQKYRSKISTFGENSQESKYANKILSDIDSKATQSGGGNSTIYKQAYLDMKKDREIYKPKYLEAKRQYLKATGRL